MLSHEQFLALPIIALKGLEGNPPADYSALQLALLPYLEQVQAFWWVCFYGTLLVLLTRFVILPLAQQPGKKADLSCPPFITDAANTDSSGNKFQQFYARLFSLREIETDVALRLFGGAILLGYIATFEYWQMNPGTTIDGLKNGTAICWPFFQSCTDWIWMRTLPYGYSQTVAYMVMFGFILLASYGLLARRIMLAHVSILILFVFRIYMTLIHFSYNGNYDYYHTLFNVIFLFLPRKRFFGSLSLVTFYFLSTATKIHPTWVWGGYFSAMKEGLPLIPKGLELIFTNFVIFMELLMSWFLFSRRVWLQRSVFAFFCFFHVYSGTLVGYHYPTIVTPPLLIFFGPLFRPFSSIPLTRLGIPGWIVFGSLLVTQIFSHTLVGDTKLTLEGNYFGLYMFEANHQCRVTYTDENKNVLKTTDSVNARDRCNPWVFLIRGQNAYCRTDTPAKVSFTMIHSINGGPFYEIVNEPDLCSLTYKPFSNNDWIKNETTAPTVGRPLENYYR